MLKACHLQLGDFLKSHYLERVSGLQIQAFLFGCVEPDVNPFTYLKGSIRCRMLHGHNFPNAAAYMLRLSQKLENKKRWSLVDFYSLGKLMHYIADAFTYAHNCSFPPNLWLHRKYELQLHRYFTEYLKHPQIQITKEHSVFDTISCLHREYSALHPDVFLDTRYAINACCSVMDCLTAGRK